MFKQRESDQFLERVRSEMNALDADIPEPDWDDFRASVRTRLLSRSVRRGSAVHRWKFAWAFSLVLAVGMTTGIFLWNIDRTLPQAPVQDIAPAQATIELPVWSEGPLFDDLVQLGDQEEQQLRQMLEMEQ